MPRLAGLEPEQGREREDERETRTGMRHGAAPPMRWMADARAVRPNDRDDHNTSG